MVRCIDGIDNDEQDIDSCETLGRQNFNQFEIFLKSDKQAHIIYIITFLSHIPSFLDVQIKKIIFFL